MFTCFVLAELRPKPILEWMSFWKSRSAQYWPQPKEAPIWQRHFGDTQLRRGQSYDEKWDYVVDNPLRTGWSSGRKTGHTRVS